MEQTYDTYEKVVHELERLKANSFATETRREWNEDGYGNLKEKIILNRDGSHTNQLAIEKFGRVVNVMTTQYWVVPNFDVIKQVEPILTKKEINAKRFAPNKSEKTYRWANGVGHKSFNVEQTEMAATYMFGDKFDITGHGDFVETGFSIRNSESGKAAFSISPFTYRNSCDNRMYHLASEKILGAGVLLSIVPDEALLKQRQRIADVRQEYSEVLRGFKKSHTKSLKLDLIEKAIIAVKLGAEQVINRYKEMYDMKLLKAQAEAISKRIPTFVTKQLDWLKVEKDGEIKFEKDLTQWEAFNDLTRILTHDGRNFAPTLNQFRRVDEILVRQQIRVRN